MKAKQFVCGFWRSSMTIGALGVALGLSVTSGEAFACNGRSLGGTGGSVSRMGGGFGGGGFVPMGQIRMGQMGGVGLQTSPFGQQQQATRARMAQLQAWQAQALAARHQKMFALRQIKAQQAKQTGTKTAKSDKPQTSSEKRQLSASSGS